MIKDHLYFLSPAHFAFVPLFVQLDIEEMFTTKVSSFPAKLQVTVCDCMPYQAGTVQGVERDTLAYITLGEILSLDPGPAAQFKYLSS